MRKFFSKAWKSSKQPRKQRKYRHHAPLHVSQKLVSAHLAENLLKEYKRRSMPARKGDEVVIMRGDFRGKAGKITGVDLKKMKVFVDTVKVKKVSGQEVQLPMEPSNIKITKMNLDDKQRKMVLERKMAAVAAVKK